MATLIPIIKLKDELKENLEAVEIQFNKNQGVSKTSFISWDRLQKIFREAGELSHYETLNKVVVNKDGIQYYTQENS